MRPDVLIVATRNAKKAREVDELLAPWGVPVASVIDFPAAPEVDETGSTFAENAGLKASRVAAALRHWTLADDSGLAVDALRGAPGVYSARYAGPGARDGDNNARLLRELDGIPDGERGAAFHCCLALADPEGRIVARAEGRCRGRLLRAARGGGGFGYDPLFWVPEYHRTFAELSLAAKSVLSHRARAFYRLQPQLAQWLPRELRAARAGRR